MMKKINRIVGLTAIALVSSSAMADAETLAEQIESKTAEGSGKLSPEVKKAFAEGIESVKAEKIVEGAKKVGDMAPDFTLMNAIGNEVNLREELKKGPVVVTWYRGGWCPYCNLALAAMQKELPAIKAAGANLIAISPELPDKVLSTTEKNELEFQVLTDTNNQVADTYGLLFKLTPEVEEIYGKFFDLKEYNGKEAGTDTLPLAATYIIGESGLIEWAFTHHDYHMRAEPADIVKFLEVRKAR
ncbi:MAG: peroxiredoxin-like family protein [Akkermansiaceae bacterium]